MVLNIMQKAKRHHACSPRKSHDSVSRSVEDNTADAMASQDVAGLHGLENSKGLKTSSQRNTARLVARAFKRKRRETALPRFPISNKVAALFSLCLPLTTPFCFSLSCVVKVIVWL